VNEDREERLYRLGEALERAQAEGRAFPDSVWAARFDLELAEVARARRAVELLAADAEPEDAGELPPPALPADYELEGELGRGGMGVVYRVRQKSLDRHLALKVLRPGEAVARRALERFRREAKSLARLRHPHIARVHEVGECEGRVYFTMDLIEGRSLAEELAERPATPAQAVRWMRQVASAIAYVHGHGLVHRDVKPANVLIDAAGDACVVDFGLAREAEVSSELTRSGHFLGTPAYMAPEQARGEHGAVGEATDVYAMGAVLYECLTGRRAFEGASIVELVAAVCEGEATPPRRIDPKIPAPLERVCLKAMARRPEERYQSAQAMLEDLERFESGRAVLAEPPSAARRFRDYASRNRASLKGAGWTAFALVGLFLVVVLPRLGSPRDGRLRSAKELVRAGETSAALRLYEEAYTSPPEPAIAREHAFPFAAALLTGADAQFAAGEERNARARIERCREVAREALELVDQPQRVQLLATLAWAEARTAGGSGVRSALDDFARELDAVVDPVTGARVFVGSGNSASVMLARFSLPTLLDPSADSHQAGVVLWGGALADPLEPGVFEWLARAVEERARVVVALLAAASELPPGATDRALPDLGGTAGREWLEVVQACDPGELRSLLAAACGEDQASEFATAALRRFSGQLIDLPAETAEELELDRMAQLLETPPHLDLARRVEVVLGGAAFGPGDARARWLASRTGRRARGGGSEAWEDLGDPATLRAQLEDSLGWETGEAPTSAAAELAAFDALESVSARRRMHAWLTMGLPEDALAPLWPEPAATEPELLADRWHALLEPDAARKTWILRLAKLRWHLGEPTPEVVEEQRLYVEEGSDVGELETIRPGSRPLSVALRGRLGWGPGGVELSFEEPRIHGGVRPTRLRLVLPGGVLRGRPGEVLAAGSIERRSKDRGEDHVDLMLACLEAGPPSGGAWKLATWRERYESQLRERLAARPSAFRSTRDRWLARLLLDDEDYRALGFDLGDPRVVRVMGDAWLQRWVLASDDVEARAAALEALDLDEHPAARARLLEGAVAAGRTLTPAEARSLARAREAARSESRKRWVLGSLLSVAGAFLLWLLAIGLRALWRMQRSGELARRWREVEPDEHAVGALAFLQGGFWWILVVPTDGPGGLVWRWMIAAGLAWYSIGLAYLASSRSGRGGWAAPVLFAAAAATGLASLLGAEAGRSWPSDAAGTLCWLGLAALPWAARELWTWEADLERRARLERRGHLALGLLVLLPFGARVLGRVPDSIWLEVFVLGAPLVGLFLWRLTLGRAMGPRIQQLAGLARERENARRRERRRALEGRAAES